MKKEYIDVVVLIFPNGTTLWIKDSKGVAYMNKAMQIWKLEHPEYLDQDETEIKLVTTRMLKQTYTLMRPATEFTLPEDLKA